MKFVAGAVPTEIIAQLKAAEKPLFFTGAGISAAAGFSTLSGPGAEIVWEYNLVEELLSTEKSRGRARLQERWLDQMLGRARESAPTAAHQALSALAARFNQCSLITQNFDALDDKTNLRARAEIVELHGAITQARCRACHLRSKINGTYQELFRSKCACGGAWRADLLLFDEALDETRWRRAERLARTCDLMIVIGSSGQILPGGLLPAIAARSSATLIEINLIQTELSPHCAVTMLGDCNLILPQLVRELLRD